MSAFFNTDPDKAGMAARIDAALPQTQCTRCGYPDCRSYADAIAQGGAGINQCPPGGAEGIRRLALLTGQAVQPLHPEHGEESPRSVAWIDENWCIGCTLCLDACPTDAILGTNKRMHTVIEAHCTGCERCIPVCPVDCIHLENASGDATGWNAWSPEQALQASERYRRRQSRLGAAARPQATDTPQPKAITPPRELIAAAAIPAGDAVASARSATIAAVLERARQQRAKRSE